MIGPFYTGDTPRDGLVVDVTRDGASVDLFGYTGAAVEVVNPLGTVVDLQTAGGSVALNAEQDTITVGFPPGGVAFTVPGIHLLRLHLLTGGAREQVSEIPVEIIDADGPLPEAFAGPSQVMGMIDGPAPSDVRILSALRIATSIVRNHLDRHLSWRDTPPPVAVQQATAMVAKRLLQPSGSEVTKTIGPFRTTIKADGSVLDGVATSLLAPYVRRAPTSRAVGSITPLASLGRRRPERWDSL